MTDGRQSDPEGQFLQRSNGVVGLAGGILGAAVAAGGIFLYFVPDAQPERTPPKLRIQHQDFEKEGNIRADWTPLPGKKGGTVDLEASLVSVVLQNPSDDPVQVTGARFHFEAPFDVGCMYGGGASEISARYDIKVPWRKRTPFTVKRKMSRFVPPHGQERLAFSVGPEQEFAGALPKIYEFTVSFETSDNARLKTQRLTHLGEAGSAKEMLGALEGAMKAGGEYAASNAECLKEQQAKVAAVVKASDIPSTSLKEFSSDLSRVPVKE